MSDSVVLRINGREVKDFQSYEVESDLYQAADRFVLELADPTVTVNRGDRCELWVNGDLELTGIVDARRRRHDKAGSSLVVEGRDLVAILVDSYVEDFVSVKGKTVKELADFLIQGNKGTGRPPLPYISRQKIVGGSIVGKGKGKKKTVDTPLTGFMDLPQKISGLEPGMTVFEVLAVHAASRGLLFYSLPDGTLVFGRPKAKGECRYSITRRADGRGNNVEASEEVDDISRRYSKVTVVSQVQGHDDFGMDTGKSNVKVSVSDKSFPFYKPFVTKLNSDSQAPKLHARMLLEKQLHDGYQLCYTLTGHSQEGTNWRINELVQVVDEKLGIREVKLIYARTFRRSKGEGSTTQVKLGPPGLVAAL